jgi:sugar-phosphatase
MNASALAHSSRGLLVDLDGTLVDSSGPVRRAWDAFARRHGLDAEAVHHFAQGRPSRDTIAALLPGTDHAAEAAAIEQAELGDPHGVVALPGADALLTSGRRLGIVTSCSRALAALRLRVARLPIPPTLVTADDVPRGKPDPMCYVLGAQHLGLRPSDCLALEDAPAGIAAAKAAGARVIALRTMHPDAELEAADAIIDDLGAVDWAVSTPVSSVAVLTR